MPKSGFIYRRAQLKGLLGGSRAWTLLWSVLFARKVLKRLLGDKPEVVYCEELPDGQALVISATGRETRVI